MSAHARVLRWSVPLDDAPHPIGAGPVCHVAVRPEATRRGLNELDVWTVEILDVPFPAVAPVPMRSVQVFGTGHPLPAGSTHLGSCVEPLRPLVWHLFDVDAGGPTTGRNHRDEPQPHH